MEPERAHEQALAAVRMLGSLGPLRSLLERANRMPRTRPVELFGVSFPNRVGMAAGWDKDGEAWPAMAALGFGHVEIGTVTAQKQPGNPRPRLFRYPREEAVINRMGFNNNGADALAHALARMPAKGSRRIPLGINIGKSRTTGLEEAAGEYVAVFNQLADYADYIAVNVSSPNTPELRKLQGLHFLPELLRELARARAERARKLGNAPVPLLLKLSPDETYRQYDAILEAVEAHGFSGLIATNTTVTRPGSFAEVEEAGGLSGRPLNARAVKVVNYLARATQGRLPIIGVGGVTDVIAAGRLMDAGASLVQLYTGLIYRGPFFARDVARALAWSHRDWV
jgi:dihydroorotate dehydrogenase